MSDQKDLPLPEPELPLPEKDLPLPENEITASSNPPPLQNETNQIIPPKRKKKIKKWIFVGILFFLIFGLSLGGFFTVNREQKLNINESTQLNTYTNENQTLSFKYPKNWQVEINKIPEDKLNDLVNNSKFTQELKDLRDISLKGPEGNIEIIWRDRVWSDICSTKDSWSKITIDNSILNQCYKEKDSKIYWEIFSKGIPNFPGLHFNIYANTDSLDPKEKETIQNILTSVKTYPLIINTSGWKKYSQPEFSFLYDPSWKFTEIKCNQSLLQIPMPSNCRAIELTKLVRPIPTPFETFGEIFLGSTASANFIWADNSINMDFEKFIDLNFPDKSYLNNMYKNYFEIDDEKAFEVDFLGRSDSERVIVFFHNNKIYYVSARTDAGIDALISGLLSSFKFTDLDSQTQTQPTGSMVACTMEAKLCADGVTSVGRSGPNCEFAKCPSE